MRFWIFLISFGLAAAQIPQKYGVGHHPLSQRRDGNGRNLGLLLRGDNKVEPNPCGPGRLPDAIGNCVEPIVNRNLFIYSAPPLPRVNPGPLPEIPTPRIDYNVVFVRTPEAREDLEPIVVPPPQKKTLIYVLTETDDGERRVIEVPTEPVATPEVIYVNYAEGDNPNLGGGVRLQDVLSHNSQQALLFDGTSQTDRPGGLTQTFPFSAQTEERYGASRPGAQTSLRPTGVLNQQRTRPSAQTSLFRVTQQRQLASGVLEPGVGRPGTIESVREGERIRVFGQPQLFGPENQPSRRVGAILSTGLGNQEGYGLNRTPEQDRIRPQAQLSEPF